MKFLAVLFCLLGFALPVFAEENPNHGNAPAALRVDDGVLAGTVYVADACKQDELRAAHDFAGWLSRVAACKKPSVKLESYAAKSDKIKIFIGDTLAARTAGVFPPNEAGETFTIESRRTQPQEISLFIIGKTPAATWHGVSYFLTKYLGVEFVFPGVDGAEWEPRKGEILLPAKPVFYVPAWTWRSVYLKEREWAIHLGLGGARPHFSHNLYSIFTPEVCEKFPELYPVIGGNAHKKFRGGYSPQPNLASAVAPKLAFEAAKNFFDASPESPMFALGINDSTNWDESQAAEAVFGKLDYYRNLPNRSDYFYSFVNKTAKLLAENPTTADKKIGVIAYLDVQNAPTFPVEKNVFPVLCADRSMWVFPKFREDDKALMERWENSGVATWGIYDYYYGNPFLFPRQFFGAQAESLKFAYEHGARLFFAEVNPIVSFDAPKIWLTSKLLEQPDADAGTLLKRFFELAYGNAQKPMREFFELCETFWKEQGGQYRWIKGYKTENAFEIFSPEKCAELSKLLKKARKAFPQNPEDERSRRAVARIDATIKNFARVEKFSRGYYDRKALQNATFQDADAATTAMKNPAWRMSQIYNDEDWTAAGFPEISMKMNDPRPAAFFSLVDAMIAMPHSPERSRAEESLEQLMRPKEKMLSADDKLFQFLRHAVPAIKAAPTLAESFEPHSFRDSKSGEWTETSSFHQAAGRDWKTGKTVENPDDWHGIFAPCEKLFAGETHEARTGKSALKISGECELVQYTKSVPAAAGQSIVARVWARGNVSCGNTAFLSFVCKDKNGRRLAAPEVATLPVGKFDFWKPLIVCGNAPDGTETVEIALGSSYQGPDDEVIFDDLSLYLYCFENDS